MCREDKVLITTAIGRYAEAAKQPTYSNYMTIMQIGGKN